MSLDRLIQVMVGSRSHLPSPGIKKALMIGCRRNSQSNAFFMAGDGLEGEIVGVEVKSEDLGKK